MPRDRIETFAEKLTRLRREIAERQLEMQMLVCGDPSKCVSSPMRSEVDVDFKRNEVK